MKKRSGFTVMLRLIGLVKPLAGFMALAVLMGLAGHLCATFITIFGGYAVLNLLGFETPLALAAVFISVGVFAVLRGLCPAKLEGKDKGDLISVITSDIELLEVFYAHTISPSLIAVLFSGVLCVFIGSFNGALALVAAAAYITVGAVIPLVTSKFSGESAGQFRAKVGELSSFVLDSLRGLSETLQYAQGENRLREMNAQTAALSADEEKMKRTASKNQAVTNTVILLFNLAMLFAAALLYQNGQVDFAGVLIPVLALMSSYGPVVALAALGSTLQNTFAAGNRVLDILDETPAVQETSGEEDITFTGAAVQKANFSYGGETILADVSLNIPQGGVVGITGKSGSGKSTLLKLLMRFWDVREGSVQISDTDIADVNTANLRDMESFVTQETHLFHDSIRNNLRIAKLDASDQEIIDACKKASVHKFIMGLPNGYDTPVGELGDTLSGGERQRIGLARAFLHDAPFMLLDEPTSNLDSLNEAVILKSLHEQRKDKTVVLVSHRRSTMQIANTVYCMENGRTS